MSVNNMSFEQSASFLTALYQEATGQQPTLQVMTPADFTTVGTTLLQMGYDPIIGAISQVLQRTIFSIRPYAQKFKDINVSEEKWGAITARRRCGCRGSTWRSSPGLHPHEAPPPPRNRSR